METPISNVEPQTLNTLFEKDPLELTDQDVSMLVAAYRNARRAWETEEKEAKSQGRRPKTKVTSDAAKRITLKDLDLGI